MKIFRDGLLCLLIGGLSILSPILGAEGMPGVVKAERLNVRIRPALDAPVLCTLTSGARLNILGRQDDWYRIALPGSCPVWLAAELVAGGRVVAEAPLQMGPGPEYENYGCLPAGKEVRILNRFEDRWLKIEAPPGICAWVAADYVTVEEKTGRASAGEPGRETVAGGARTEAEKAGPTYATRYLAEIAPQAAGPGRRPFQLTKDADERHLAAEGIIFPIQNPTSQITHGLVWKIDRQYYPICYLSSETFQLSKVEFKRVMVEGELSHVAGWSRPVLNVGNLTVFPW